MSKYSKDYWTRVQVDMHTQVPGFEETSWRPVRVGMYEVQLKK